MMLRVPVRKRDRLYALGLLIGLIGLTAPTTAESQSTSSIQKTAYSFIINFNRLASNLSEMKFRYSDIGDDKIQSWRARTCEGLMQVYQTSEEIPQLLIIVSENVVRQIPMSASSSDAFTTFLAQEKEHLTNATQLQLGELTLSGHSWEIVLQQAIRFRPQIATSTPKRVAKAISEISIKRLREGTTLLCDNAYSPVGNESTAGWKTWLWHGVEFVGGTAVFLGNLLGNPEPSTKAMSMYLGSIVAGTGYSGLSALLRSSQ